MELLTRSPEYLEYRREIEDNVSFQPVRAGILIILGVTAAFPLLDWIIYPQRFASLLLVRAGLALSFVPLWFLAPRGSKELNARDVPT